MSSEAAVGDIEYVAPDWFNQSISFLKMSRHIKVSLHPISNMASLWLEMALAGNRLSHVCYCKPMSTYINWYIGDVSFRKIVQILGVLITTPYREIGQKTCLV